MPPPLFLFPPALPRRPRRPRAVSCTRPRMSGVNGGIDYEIDLTKLPTALAERITYIQNGPDSPSSLISAAKQIAHATEDYPQTLPVLVDMLGFNNPPAARIAISALVRAGSSAIPPLLTGVAAFNYSVNAYALRALAAIGDPSVLQVCLACATTGPIPNVRRAACKALGSLRYVEPKQASAAYECLMKLADGEPDWGVRYAAIVGLERFVALQLVDDDVRRLACSVVQAAAEGKAHVLVDETRDESGGIDARVSFDPTVAARATLALENMRDACEVSVQV